jgi:hypothetical protein
MEQLVKGFLKFRTEVFGKKTTQENVRSQLDHFRTHPSVALLLRKKQVDLHGWVYSISTGDVWVYDFEIEQFTSLLDETYPRLKISSESWHAPSMSTSQLETLSFDNTYARLPEKGFSVIDRLLTLSQDSAHPTAGHGILCLAPLN